MIPMLQRADGTVFRVMDEQWQSLSPLFGEWLDCPRPTVEERAAMQPYPARLNVPEGMEQQFIYPHENIKRFQD